MNKKRWLVIAIALFLVIGTGSFVFANPSDSSLNGKGTLGSDSSSQSNQTNLSGSNDNSNIIQNDGSFDAIGNDSNGENLTANGDLISSTMGNATNENGTNNGGTIGNINNNNTNQNNPSSTVGGGNNSSNSSSNNNSGNTNNGNNNSGNNGNSGSTSNPGTKPTEPEIPDVVDPKPSTPEEEKPTSNFAFVNLKPFYENKIEISDPNYVSITIRNWTKNITYPTRTDRVIELDGCDTYTFTVCYSNMTSCPSYTMYHICSAS